MTVNNFNLKLILVHVLASCFLVLAVKQFVASSETDLINLYTKGNLTSLEEMQDLANRIMYLNLWLGLSPLIGALAGFFISIGITVRRKIKWQHSLIVLATAVLINRVGFFDTEIIRSIHFGFGNLFAGKDIMYVYFANGILFATAGLLIFLIFEKFYPQPE